MTPRSLSGRIVDEEGRPLAGLVVARDANASPDETSLATRTDHDGAFHLALDEPRRFLPAPPRPVVWDAAGLRRLARLAPRHDGAGAWRAGEVAIPRTEAEGFLATGGTGAPLRLARDARVGLLVDGEALMRETLRLVRDARRRLWMSQLLLEPALVAHLGGAPHADEGRVLDALEQAVARGVDVRVMLNENLFVPDSVDEVRARLDARDERRVLAWPGKPAVMHAKIVLRDDAEALVVDPPLEQRYWDSREHRLDEPRRDGAPMHDAGLHLTGGSVRIAADVFARLWNSRSGGPPLDPSPDMTGAGSSGGRTSPCHDGWAQTLLTLPGPLDEGGEAGILEAYLRALGRARHLVYLETQYFTDATIARALDRALAREPRLEVILVVNETMDIPGYDQWQARRLADLGWPDRERLGVFGYWRAGWRDARFGIANAYVHTKFGLVDDVWATLGSANLDGVSLQGAREFAAPDVRNVEYNVAIVEGVDGAPATGGVAAMRAALWSEALGLGENEAAALFTAGEAAGADDATGARSPLDAWREAARANLTDLADGRAPRRGLVLPHKPDVPDGVAVFSWGMSVLDA